MNGFILGEKSVQSQRFLTSGERIPTTYIKTSPCYILSVQTPERNGYTSVKLGFKKIKKIKKTNLGQIKKAGIETPLRFFREFRIDKPSSKVKLHNETDKEGIVLNDKNFTVGQEVKPADMFEKGDFITVSGISKGKGFQGVVFRHGFKGGSKTHGQSDRQRAPGSIGMTTTPGRVFKGKRMAGRTGSEKITITNLEVIEVDENGITVKGLIPGAIGGLVTIVTS